MKKLFFYSFVLSLGFAASVVFAQNPCETALKAYSEKDYPVYLENIRRVAYVAGNNPDILYKVAGAYALTGDREKAMEWLQTTSPTASFAALTAKAAS